MLIVRWPDGRIHIVDVEQQVTMCGRDLKQLDWWQMGFGDLDKILGLDDLCDVCKGAED